MKPSLQFRLSQHLALTPQLQQSIRLLQLSTLELHQEVEQMLEMNPFLEPEEEFPAVDTAASLEFERQRNERTSSHGNAPASSARNTSDSAGDEWLSRLNASASTKMIARPLRMAVGLP